MLLYTVHRAFVKPMPWMCQCCESRHVRSEPISVVTHQCCVHSWKYEDEWRVSRCHTHWGSCENLSFPRILSAFRPGNQSSVDTKHLHHKEANAPFPAPDVEGNRRLWLRQEIHFIREDCVINQPDLKRALSSLFFPLISCHLAFLHLKTNTWKLLNRVTSQILQSTWDTVNIGAVGCKPCFCKDYQELWEGCKRCRI